MTVLHIMCTTYNAIPLTLTIKMNLEVYSCRNLHLHISPIAKCVHFLPVLTFLSIPVYLFILFLQTSCFSMHSSSTKMAVWYEENVHDLSIMWKWWGGM
jgi:hypothetical protein